MALTGAHASGATPLDEEDLEGLKDPFCTTQGELNAIEQANIIVGQEWALATPMARLPGMLTDDFSCRLHAEMFGNVWTWAGDHRKRMVNIGPPPYEVPMALHEAFADASYWIEHGTYPPQEIAVRLHHRLVSVHPFRNGNGRQTRMFADILLIRHFKEPRLTWGGGELGYADPRRADYIAALGAADYHDYAPLLQFARS